MNRAEKRRQRKSAKKALKSKARSKLGGSQLERQQQLTTQIALDLAMQHHNAGLLPKAESIYQQILQTDPKHPIALHLLGMIALQMGKNDVALDLITKALAVEPNNANAYDAQGNALMNLERLDEAIASYNKALAIEPDYADVHNNLGIALMNTGRLNEAIASYNKALAIKPDYAEAHNNLGIALWGLGKPDDAVASYHNALSIKPDDAEAHNNLGNVFYELEKSEDAFKCRRRAVSLDPENDLFWDGFAASLETLSFTSVDDNLWQDLLHLLERPTVGPSYLIRPIFSALRHYHSFSQILELISSVKPKDSIIYADAAEQLSSIPLFLRILELCPISDLEIERMLTSLRRSMIEETIAGKTNDKSLPFSAALALQCFTNEYVFNETDEEKNAVELLQQQIARLVEKEQDVPPSSIAALGAYRPLYCFPWAQKLCESEWSGSVKSVIKRQITEPQEEQSLRDRIPRLTSIRDKVSQAVRQQYEESPYPRWVKTEMAPKSRAIGAVLKEAPLRLDLGDYASPESPEILIVGCGTGQHVLITSSRFSNAQILAVDLSLGSLSYALRKTGELEPSNIEYAQGDIMELGNFGRQFDLIECSGTLHHLGDPLAGWKVLVDLLRPGGIMRIGLYSEVARQDIICGHSLVSKKGYTASPEDIRRCRQDIVAKAEDGNLEMAAVCSCSDFFSLSNCRDLLFHVQEHRFTLPQIEAALETLKLAFLGFGIRDQSVLRKFRKCHPKRRALTSLSLWHEFELKNPDTFQNMYQFWCKKI